MTTISQSSSPKTFKNPLLQKGQDPFIVYHNNLYNLIQSDNGKQIVIYQSSCLSRITLGNKQIVWSAPVHGANCCNVWAPELFFFDAKWYIYYAADIGENESHRMFVLESEGSNPMGPYHDKGKLIIIPDRWAIDGTVFQNQGQLYCVWSGWPSEQNVQQNLYITTMSNPWTINGESTLLAEPTYSWEKPESGPWVNEGPQLLVHHDRLYLVYSANGSWTDNYCLGLLIHAGGPLTDPQKWSKVDHPIFSKSLSNSVYGPGHCSFVKSPDGTEDWIIYHANSISGSSWGGRSIRGQKFGWNGDGTPDFGVPVSLDMPLVLPSGE